MTLNLSLNPHSFVVFMTLATGISYVFFNSRRLFSLGKLLALLILIVPFVLMGFEQGHIVDIGLGTLIGWLTARGGLGFIDVVLDSWPPNFTKRESSYSQERPHSTEQGNARQAEAEFKRRQEQAKQGRQQNRSNNNSTGGHAGEQNKQQKSSSYRQSNSQNKTEYERPVEQPKTPLQLAYEVLGINPTTSYDEAKKRYRKMISRYHEDKMQDFPEAEVEEAKEKSKAINVAWDLICAKRGWK